MELIFWLLFAHYLADYPLQGDFLAMKKGESFQILFAHAFIWTGCLSVVLMINGLFSLKIAILALLIPHFIADYAKARNLWFYRRLGMWQGLAIDQSFHFVQIIFIYMLTK